ncbi:MAG: PadR family transcriptional regulator [Acidobacteria bacterium]|nr:PadR family transcriptional regulator [Acidobacteriota bacterium]
MKTDDTAPTPTLGELELLVVLAILRCGDEAYGVTITEEIRRRTGRRLARAAVYVTLRRLHERGLVRSTTGTPLPERGGKARRYYSIEPEGLDRAQATQTAFTTMWDGISLAPADAPEEHR